ncbi:hypothetical protein HU200_040292 [Digitaria exilis]|uniref:Uncharacterized protein n=1 Tax=Digitaria exilis TaxID=1010633 RepID=A0A835B8Q5_9POAL|nr:hypothetical protein HU200_040292 [Digitaria exilis]
MCGWSTVLLLPVESNESSMLLHTPRMPSKVSYLPSPLPTGNGRGRPVVVACMMYI